MTKNLLRPPTTSNGDASRRTLLPIVLALVAALTAGGLVLATQLIGPGTEPAGPVPSFLGSALGKPDAGAPLVRTPRPGTTVEIAARGHAVRTEDG